MHLSDIAHATAFLTRLPVPAWLFADRPLNFARCAWAFPIAAALSVIPAITVLIATSIGRIETGLIAPVLAYAALATTTGCLHEDGAADVADGFWGGRDRSRRLEIMRDSRIGTYGVVALACLFLFRVAALFELLVANRDLSIGRMELHGYVVPAAALLASHATGKVALLMHWVSIPSARPGEGLAQRFGTPTGGQIAIAGAIALFLVTPAVLTLHAGATAVAFALGLAALVAFLFGRLARAKIGGHTGDTLGAAAVLGECAFLLGLVLTISRA